MYKVACAVLGMVLTIAGAVFMERGQVLVNEQEFITKLKPWNPALVAKKLPTRPGYLEGTIAQENFVVHNKLVAYERETYQGREEDGRQRWVVDEVKAPHFTLKVDGDHKVLVQKNYALKQPITLGTFVGNPKQGVSHRYNGFPRLAQVVVLGDGTDGKGGGLPVQKVIGGSFRTYKKRILTKINETRIAGIICVSLGLLLLGALAFMRVRARQQSRV